MKTLTIALTLALATTASSAATKGEAVASPAATAFDAGAEWTRFLATGSATGTDDAYGVLGDVGYDGTHVRADACRDASASLDQAVAAVPVGLALRHARMLCAEATGQGARADEELAAIGALVKHTVARSGNGAWTQPLRIVRPEDIDTFATAGGYERRYAFYSRLHPTRYFPVSVALYDAERRTERVFEFDFVDVLVQLKSDSPLHGYPFNRYSTGVAYIDAWASGGDVASVDARAMRDAWAENDLGKRRDLLKAAAGRGGLASARRWLALCREATLARCADGLADALLPLAEQGQGAARVTLAMAYLEGIGVRRDEAAARALIESTDRTWADRGASVELAEELNARSAAWPTWLVSRLDDPAIANLPAVRGVRVLGRILSKQPVSDPDRAFLEAPANNHQGMGLALLAALASDAKDPSATSLRDRAAAAGDAPSQVEVALALLKDGKEAAADRLMRDAAAGGDASAGWFVAATEMRAGRLLSARNWLLPGVVEGNVDSQVQLANLYTTDAPDLGGGPKDAREMFEELADASAEARMRLAGMLLRGDGGPKDVARARALLTRDAEAGEVEAQTALASSLADGSFGKAEPAAARRWFERAIAKGDDRARRDYGSWLVHEATPADRARGIALLRAAIDSDSEIARNNLAWALCTSPFDDVRDGRAGLEVARGLGDPAKLDAGTMDTVAACHAAASEFARAVDVQAAALAATPDAPLYAAMRKNLEKRLALYRDGQVYIETASEE